MKKIFKSRLFMFILGILLTSGVVYAANMISSSDVSYRPENDEFNVSNVKSALDELYDMADGNKVTFIISDCTLNESNTRSVKTGNTIGSLPTPVCGENVFEGWYLDDTYQTQVDSSYTPTGNVNIYGKVSRRYYIFKDGAFMHTDVYGGFVKWGGDSSVSAAVDNDGYYVVDGGTCTAGNCAAYYGMANPIDLTNYSKLVFVVQKVYNPDNALGFGHRITDTKSYTATSIRATWYNSSNMPQFPYVEEINIADLTGNHYIEIVTGQYNHRKQYIKEIYLVP